MPAKKTPSIFTDEQEEDITLPTEPMEDEQEEEEIPEAFIPSFTIAPEEIPPEYQSLPTQDQKKQTEQSIFDKLGYSQVKNFLAQPVQESTPEKDKFIRDSSHLAAIVLSACFMWGYSLVGGVEYGVLAPTEEEAEKIVRPIMNIVGRHSKIIGQISPDAVDIGNCFKAISDYANHSMEMLAMIREDKQFGRQGTAREYATERQARNYQQGVRSGVTSNDSRNGYSPISEQDTTDDGDVLYRANLTDDERRNYEALQQLGKKDLEHRLRQAGRL